MTASTSIPNPRIERVNRYLMRCPDCRWTKEFIGGPGRAPTERHYEVHYLAEHDTGRSEP